MRAPVLAIVVFQGAALYRINRSSGTPTRPRPILTFSFKFLSNQYIERNDLFPAAQWYHRSVRSSSSTTMS